MIVSFQSNDRNNSVGNTPSVSWKFSGTDGTTTGNHEVGSNDKRDSDSNIFAVDYWWIIKELFNT
jgi:hypothetical protein